MAPSSTPLPYRLFLLYIEPLFTLSGAIAAFYFPRQYLSMTYASPPSLTATLSPGVHVVLRQLGNLYCAFALIEALVLRSTNDVTVWRALLLPLLIADFGHLLSVLPVGKEVYWEVGRWGPMDWGNLGFVYCGAVVRICFLAGVGLGMGNGGGGKGQKRQRRSKPAARITDGEVKESKVPKTPATGTRKRAAKKGVE